MMHQTAKQQFEDTAETPQPKKIPVFNLAEGQAELDAAVEQFICDISPSIKRLIELKLAKKADTTLP